MMLIVGTVPIEDLPMIMGKVGFEGKLLVVDGHQVPCTQGTGAMVSAALATTEYMGLEPPNILLAGDIGKGKGSRQMYEYIIDKVAELLPEVLALHYCLPDMTLTRRLCQAVDKCNKRPFMIADAASMYAAKAAGLAGAFDIFTPDSTEMAFLADTEATHPAYISRHLFDTDIEQTPVLVDVARKHKNLAKLVLVKGATDYVVDNGDILATITEPDVPELEAIGGTGDTITGILAAFIYAGLEPKDAAIIAARTNRMAGQFARATPATRVKQIIDQFPDVFREYLCQWSGVCFTEGGDSND